MVYAYISQLYVPAQRSVILLFTFLLSYTLIQASELEYRPELSQATVQLLPFQTVSPDHKKWACAENFLWDYFDLDPRFKTLDENVQHLISPHLLELTCGCLIFDTPVTEYLKEGTDGEEDDDWCIRALDISRDNSHLLYSTERALHSARLDITGDSPTNSIVPTAKINFAALMEEEHFSNRFAFNRDQAKIVFCMSAKYHAQKIIVEGNLSSELCSSTNDLALQLMIEPDKARQEPRPLGMGYARSGALIAAYSNGVVYNFDTATTRTITLMGKPDDYCTVLFHPHDSRIFFLHYPTNGELCLEEYNYESNQLSTAIFSCNKEKQETDKQFYKIVGETYQRISPEGRYIGVRQAFSLEEPEDCAHQCIKKGHYSNGYKWTRGYIECIFLIDIQLKKLVKKLYHTGSRYTFSHDSTFLLKIGDGNFWDWKQIGRSYITLFHIAHGFRVAAFQPAGMKGLHNAHTVFSSDGNFLVLSSNDANKYGASIEKSKVWAFNIAPINALKKDLYAGRTSLETNLFILFLRKLRMDGLTLTTALPKIAQEKGIPLEPLRAYFKNLYLNPKLSNGLRGYFHRLMSTI